MARPLLESGLLDAEFVNNAVELNLKAELAHARRRVLLGEVLEEVFWFKLRVPGRADYWLHLSITGKSGFSSITFPREGSRYKLIDLKTTPLSAAYFTALSISLSAPQYS